MLLKLLAVKNESIMLVTPYEFMMQKEFEVL